MRPGGTRPTPTAESNDKEVVDIAGISETARSPKRMIDPLPNLFSMLSSAASMARLRSAIRSSGITGISFFCSSFDLCVSRGIPQETEDNTLQARMEQSFTHETHIFSRGFRNQIRLIWRLGSPLCAPKVRRNRSHRKITRKNTLRRRPRRVPSHQRKNLSNQKDLMSFATIAGG